MPTPNDTQSYITETSSAPLIEVTTSTRATKSASARFRDGRYIITVPLTYSATQRQQAIDSLTKKINTRVSRSTASPTDLLARTTALADAYVNGVRPTAIDWVTNQNSRWGSCSVESRTIRLSHRLQLCPTWVQDAVIVHELTHLIEANHGDRFYAIANRYPRQAEAHTFLKGYSLGLSTTA
jgi:hypothetical protein